MSEFKIEPDQIKKVVFKHAYSNFALMHLDFLFKDDSRMKLGEDYQKPFETILSDDERIVGISAQSDKEDSLFDFQFIIANSIEQFIF